jgi:hypothetical protein
VRQLIFIIFGGVAVFVFFKSILDFKYQAPTQPPSPIEQVEAILSQNPIPARSLHSIYRKFPDLVTKQLKNRTVEITGRVDRINVAGFEKDKAELSLENLTAPQIWLVNDLNTHRLFAEAKSHEKMQWEISQNRLYLVEYGFAVEENRKTYKAIRKIHTLTQGHQISFPCVLKKWNSGSLYFYYESIP